ncbi:MAG: CDP-alcohol phosphatidyltransferase family protein [Sulfuricellaceae bacterium]|nr:CDP-alcohol phosphatidyltransferase family protein [Sulfuricellaceae bacterium]
MAPTSTQAHWLNPANAITLLRLALVPLIVFLLAEGNFGAALGLFAVAGISDALDGYIARRYRLVTQIGSLLDPLADKLLITATVLSLAYLQRLPLWLTLLIVGRDGVILIGALAFRLLTGRLEMAPTLLSKLNTFAQLGLALGILADATHMIDIASWRLPLYAIVTLTTLWSGAQYVWLWGRKVPRPARAEQHAGTD